MYYASLLVAIFPICLHYSIGDQIGEVTRQEDRLFKSLKEKNMAEIPRNPVKQVGPLHSIQNIKTFPSLTPSFPLQQQYHKITAPQLTQSHFKKHSIRIFKL